jgi:hypothetical protein
MTYIHKLARTFARTWHGTPAHGPCTLLPFALIVILSGSASFAQTPKTADTSNIQIHSPGKASLYSALLPGLGQAYNKKYWKIPIIYGGFATLAYFINMNNKEYKKFNEAYVYVSSGDTTPIDNDYVDKYSQSSLQTGRDYYRRNLEISVLLTSALYVLNIIDAAVDAHLYTFDISEDLSVRLEPRYDPWSPFSVSGGLRITLRL